MPRPTLLLRCLLRLLEESKDITYAYIFNNRLSSTEFLQYMLLDFGLPAAGKNKCEMLFDLSQFLVSRSARQMTTVLIVDEAHLLSEELLEEVRLLSNLETYDDKLLQIVLVGQPELDEKLDSVELRQLKQRIALRSHLATLDLSETQGYIERRLQLAGSSDPGAIFPPETVATIHHYSRGTPRLINTICENALVVAYARQAKSVATDVIEGIAVDFRLNVHTPMLERKRSTDDQELRKAARTLLELYAHLQGGKTNDGEMALHMPLRVTKQ